MAAEKSIKPSLKYIYAEATKAALLLAIATLISCWLFDISIWKAATIYLAAAMASMFAILKTTSGLLDSVISNSSRQYRISRTYNIKGEEFRNRFVLQISDGHWATIITDMLNNDVIAVEHTRTDANIEESGRDSCIAEEHAFNHASVWGEKYQGPIANHQIIIGK